MGADLVHAVTDAVLVPLLFAVFGSLGAWLTTKIPGPLRAWLQSGTHQRDIELILGAMARRALAQASGGIRTATAATDLVGYVRANLPEVVAKLGPSDDALATMAAAALHQAEEPRAGA
jgi:hypothetical protein